MKTPKGFFLSVLLPRFEIFAAITFVCQLLYWPFVRIPLHLFGKLVIVGKGYVTKGKGGFIFAVNHQSQLDPFIVPAALNPFSSIMPMYYVSRERNYYDVRGIARYAYGGFVFRIFGAYPAIVKIKDYEQMLVHHIRILLRGNSVCIFPEGKLNTGTHLAQGKPGVAYLLWRTGRPVIPVAISGHEGMGPLDYFMRKHKIIISYGEPITREELFGNNCQEQPSHDELIAATGIIMSRIQMLLDRNKNLEQKVVQGLQSSRP